MAKTLRSEAEKETSGLENEQTGQQPTGSAWPELSDKPDKTVSPVTLQATPSQEESAHSEITKPVHFGFDIGTSPEAPTTKELEEMIRKGHLPHPEQFPNDITGRKFPTSVLKFKQSNCEMSFRRWLPEHEHSTVHKKCYLARREFERRLEEFS